METIICRQALCVVWRRGISGGIGASITCSSNNCKEIANVWVDNGAHCTTHGVSLANRLNTNTQPIISIGEYLDLTDSDIDYFDPQTVILGEDGSEEEIFSFEDVGTEVRMVVTNGLTSYREPIVMARCIHCESIAVGHLNKVGGWIARHSHYHNHYVPEDDFAAIEN